MVGYRTILACLNNIATASSTLGLAFLVGREYSAHVEALHVRASDTSALFLVSEGFSETRVQEMLTTAEGRALKYASQIRAKYDETCARLAVPTATVPPALDQFTANWREQIGREEEIVADAGCLVDLLVMARPPPDCDRQSIMTLDAALTTSGSPPSTGAGQLERNRDFDRRFDCPAGLKCRLEAPPSNRRLSSLIQGRCSAGRRNADIPAFPRRCYDNQQLCPSLDPCASRRFRVGRRRIARQGRGVCVGQGPDRSTRLRSRS